MAKKNMYGHMYSQINMNTMPGEMRMPGSGTGKDVAKQAEALNYQDIPRDIQAMRQAEYNKEVKEGEFVPEFSGYRRNGPFPSRRKNFSGYLGDAAKKTAPGLLLAGALIALYWMFSGKQDAAAPESEEILFEEPVVNPDDDEFEVDDFDLVD